MGPESRSRSGRLFAVALIAALLLLLPSTTSAEGKRSRGRSRGTSCASCNSHRKHHSGSGQATSSQTQSQSHQELASLSYPNYGSNAKKSDVGANKPKPDVNNNQPSAPAQPAGEAPVRKSASVDANNQKPMGWDPAATNQQHGASNYHQQQQQHQQQHQANANQRPIGWNVGSNAQHPPHQPLQNAPQQSSYPSYGGNGGAYPNAGAGQYYGGGGYGNGHQYNPQQPFQGYYPTSNIGVVPPRGSDAGHYYNSVSGLNNNSPLFASGYGGGGRPGGGGGLFGSLFGGGARHGAYGGLGGYGGYGGYGNPGYYKKSHGLFGKNAFRNVLAGVLIWSLLRGAVSTPYNVYSHQHRPAWMQQEMTLPSNAVTLCAENASNLCAPGSVPLCTTNSTIFCVVTASNTVPCGDGLSCLNATLPCLEENDPLCRNATEQNATSATTTIQLPCISNVTVEGGGDGQTFCVTTVAVPQPLEEAANVTASACDPASTCAASGANATGAVDDVVQVTTTLPPPGTNETATDGDR